MHNPRLCSSTHLKGTFSTESTELRAILMNNLIKARDNSPHMCRVSVWELIVSGHIFTSQTQLWTRGFQDHAVNSLNWLTKSIYLLSCQQSTMEFHSVVEPCAQKTQPITYNTNINVHCEHHHYLIFIQMPYLCLLYSNTALATISGFCDGVRRGA